MKPLTYRHTRIACYGAYVTQAVIVNLAPLLFTIFQRRFGVTLEEVGSLILLNFTTQLLVDLVAARLADKIGYRNGLVIAHLFCISGLAALAFLPQLMPSAFAGLVIAAVIYAVGGGYLEVLISPLVESLPGEEKEKAMSLLHSFYCWGTVGVILLSTLFLQAAGRDSWSLLALLWAILPLCNAVYFTQVPIAPLTQEGESLPLGKLFSMKLFWVFALLMVAAGACEQAMSQWASAFAESGLGVSKAVGDLAGPCMFSVLMGLSRVAYAKWGGRLSLLNCEIACGLLCAGGYLLAALAPHPALALVGCGICGVSVGILWPGTFSVASRHCPKGGTAMFALLALAGDLGCTSGPTLVGMASGLLGGQLKAGLLLAVVFPALLIGAALACKRLLARGESPARKG